MRRALVLSGGGGKASWQVGACEHLIAERGYWFDVIVGVSAGAVNATTLAQAHDPLELVAELEHLRSVWLGMQGNHDIFRRRWLGTLGAVLGRRPSLYHTAPLRRILEDHIDPARVASSPIRLSVGYIDLLSGTYRRAGNDHPALRDVVLASCSLPVLFPPVPLENGRELGVDGGLGAVTPLPDAVSALADPVAPGEEPDEVWVLSTHVTTRMPETTTHSWLSVAMRSLSVVTSQPFRGIGDLGPPDAPRIKLRVLHPRQELQGPTLDFDPAHVRAWYEDGLRTARQSDDEDTHLDPTLSLERPCLCGMIARSR